VRDYNDQQWERAPDPETIRDNEFAGILVAVFIGVVLAVFSWVVLP
jgi:hypothetical protein